MNAPVTPRAAATTLILRQGAPGLEVLMVRRALQSSFMPGAYVFPGWGVGWMRKTARPSTWPAATSLSMRCSSASAR